MCSMPVLLRPRDTCGLLVQLPTGALKWPSCGLCAWPFTKLAPNREAMLAGRKLKTFPPWPPQRRWGRAVPCYPTPPPAFSLGGCSVTYPGCLSYLLPHNKPLNGLKQQQQHLLCSPSALGSGWQGGSSLLLVSWGALAGGRGALPGGPHTWLARQCWPSSRLTQGLQSVPMWPLHGLCGSGVLGPSVTKKSITFMTWPQKSHGFHRHQKLMQIPREGT